MTTRRQSVALREQRALRDRLRAWRDERRAAADERERERRKADAARPRGKDRVPTQLRVAGPVPAALVEHQHPNYRWRRTRALYFGSGLPTGKNQSRVNPDKDRRLAGKARIRARRAAARASS